VDDKYGDKPRTRTYSVSLYPDDIDVIRILAATRFQYNESEAARFIVRWFADTMAGLESSLPIQAA